MKVDVVKLLLSRGVAVDQEDGECRTPLHIATRLNSMFVRGPRREGERGSPSSLPLLLFLLPLSPTIFIVFPCRFHLTLAADPIPYVFYTLHLLSLPLSPTY